MNDNISNYIKEHTNSLDDIEQFKLGFGKYKGVHIEKIFYDDPQYIKFCWEKARLRLSPAIHKFIINNWKFILTAIKEQNKLELEVFSSSEDI